MAPRPRPRLLIFVIAYYAEATLKRVLERIPSEIFEKFDCEVLVVDDASQDRTFEIGQEYKAAHPEIRMTVLRNEFNQGYGGNQKVGYSYAVANDFDIVAMVHGDGQYAPEELPKLVAPLAQGEADAVFGSRMMTRFGALKGGMPLYKFVGNKILTTAQNALLGTKLSEFHTGYRLYSVPTLRQIRYELNSNDFHFDTEIIIQLLNAKARILELPIPTFYGDEISRVNGMKYAKDVMLATARNALHRAGLLYARKFDPKTNVEPELKLGYPSSHTLALEAVNPGSQVLEISTGAPLGGELAKKGAEVAWVQHGELRAPEGVKALNQDLDGALKLDVRPYDTLLLLDVLEHLRSPESFMEELRHQFGYEPKRLIITVPNVAFIVPRLMHFVGQFNQGKTGILDSTHTRHFTWRSLRRLLLDQGLRIQRVRGIPAPFVKALGEGLVARTATRVNQLLIGLSKGLFAYQFYVEAETTPDVWFVLRDSKERSDRRAMTKPQPRPRLTTVSSGSAAKKRT